MATHVLNLELDLVGCATLSTLQTANCGLSISPQDQPSEAEILFANLGVRNVKIYLECKVFEEMGSAIIFLGLIH